MSSDPSQEFHVSVSSPAPEVPPPAPDPAPKQRKVSINANPVTEPSQHHDVGVGGAAGNQDASRRRLSVASEQLSEGPIKSILLNHDSASVKSHHSGYTNYGMAQEENGNQINNEAPRKKYSTAESSTEKIQYPEYEIEKSCLFLFCKKCRHGDHNNSWEPPHWQRICPYPFCPSYRKFARLIALFLIGLLLWGVAFSVLGETAAPGGQLFGLALLSIAAHFGGWLMTLTTLPALIGMLIVGVLFQNVGIVHIEGEYIHVVAVLRKIALVIILTRAGLDLEPGALKRLWVTVIKLGLVPWTVEAGVVAVMSHFLLDMPWIWGLLLGAIVAAVSPAVVVPCLFRLRGKGYGVAKGIPTLIIAVAGIDDACSVAIFGIIHSIMFSTDTLTYQIIQGPLSFIMGIGFGVVWGVLSKYVPEKEDNFAVPLRILMLFGGGLIAVFGSDLIGFGGAGPLGCVAAAFVSSYVWSQQGWEIDDNPVATAFEIFWMIFEPILFGITGAQVVIKELDHHTVTLGLAILFTGIIIRIAMTVLIAVRSRLNLKEKIFVALSWMAKATVQAALGPVALDSVRNSSNKGDQVFAETLLTVCILSIILTAPIGAILITLSGKRLLNKTTAPIIMEGWRRSARPSLRDISIINEEDSESVAT